MTSTAQQTGASRPLLRHWLASAGLCLPLLLTSLPAQAGPNGDISPAQTQASGLTLARAEAGELNYGLPQKRHAETPSSRPENANSTASQGEARPSPESDATAPKESWMGLGILLLMLLIARQRCQWIRLLGAPVSSSPGPGETSRDSSKARLP